MDGQMPEQPEQRPADAGEQVPSRISRPPRLERSPRGATEKSSGCCLLHNVGCGTVITVFIIMFVLIAVLMTNVNRVPSKALEAEVKQNLHAIQLALERYAVDAYAGGAPIESYPVFLMGGDWTDSFAVWQQWADNQGLDPDAIADPERGGANWRPAEPGMGDALIMEAYMPSYPENPFLQIGQGRRERGVRRLHYFPYPAVGAPWERTVGGREGDKMYEVFGPVWLSTNQPNAGDFYVHHIFNDPPYDQDGDMYKEPPGGWSRASGNPVLVGNFSYYPLCKEGKLWSIVNGKIATGSHDVKALNYMLAGYGAVRTKGQDVYNRNGNYRGRYRTEPCRIDCTLNLYPEDVPCICGGSSSSQPPSREMNDGGPDTIPDGVIITLSSGTDTYHSAGVPYEPSPQADGK